MSDVRSSIVKQENLNLTKFDLSNDRLRAYMTIVINGLFHIVPCHCLYIQMELFRVTQNDEENYPITMLFSPSIMSRAPNSIYVYRAQACRITQQTSASVFRSGCGLTWPYLLIAIMNSRSVPTFPNWAHTHQGAAVLVIFLFPHFFLPITILDAQKTSSEWLVILEKKKP